MYQARKNVNLTGKPATSRHPMGRTADQVRQHYEIEKELAARLRQATTQAERRSLYHVVYDERLKRIPAHPLLTQAQDPAARNRAAAPQVRLICSFLRPDAVFLEVGPGDCTVALGVARRARQVFAVDVSDGLVQDAARPANFEFFFSDGISVPVPPSSVNLAYSSQVMEHLHPDDALEQLRNIHKALVSKGAYLCVTPNALSGPWDISRGFDDMATGLHLKEYTITELAQQFRAAGFSRVRALLSYRGFVLSPLLPVAPFAMVERVLHKLPRESRRLLANALVAVKVIGFK
jgi:SAM-dependent methyltransferase